MHACCSYENWSVVQITERYWEVLLFSFLTRSYLSESDIWILSSQGGKWYDTETDDCSIEEIRKATHGVIQFDYQLNANSPNDVFTVTNKTFME